MNKTLSLTALTISAAIAIASTGGAVPAFASTAVGKAAPDFALADVNGKVVKLADFKGKHVVLEWSNPGCPFVQKHYDSNNMQSLQKKYDAKDTVWLTINSTNASHQDYLSNEKLNGYITAKNAEPDAYMADADGKVGRLFGAKTTPHMYVINPAGMVIYAGAIDDKPSANKADVAGAKNYVVAALAESSAGKAVSVATTPAYGCSVKY